MVNNLRSKISTVKPAVVKIISKNQTETSEGSGFIVTNDGIFISNSHVILDNDPSLTIVQFHDKTIKKCSKFIHRDNDHDFAIMKLEDGNYNHLELGEYENIEEGDSSYFCGYPLLTENHVTHNGIVSAKFTENGLKILQLDASVNSGNSGGPLLNMDDKVVGIITEKEGGVRRRLVEIGKFLEKKGAFMKFTSRNKTTGQSFSVAPNQTLGEVINIIRHYTNVGIGYGFSIEYAKSKLKELNLIE